VLSTLLGRRLSGEPLAWITGHVVFGDLTLGVHPGVYVPRWQSIELAHRAISGLSQRGTAVDLCTGSGVLAMALHRSRPRARVLATDIDAVAVRCARENGIEAFHGDLFSPLPEDTLGSIDLVVAVAPYVPTSELGFLPADTLEFEDAAHYEGGAQGVDIVRRIIEDAPAYLVAGGTLLLELGGRQDELVHVDLQRAGFTDVDCWTDDEGDLRGMEAIYGR
jgi:release factor glutamine methyltransferase